MTFVKQIQQGWRAIFYVNSDSTSQIGLHVKKQK